MASEASEASDFIRELVFDLETRSFLDAKEPTAASVAIIELLFDLEAEDFDLNADEFDRETDFDR